MSDNLAHSGNHVNVNDNLRGKDISVVFVAFHTNFEFKKMLDVTLRMTLQQKKTTKLVKNYLHWL